MTIVYVILALLVVFWLYRVSSTPEAARGALRADVRERLTLLRVSTQELREATKDKENLPQEFLALMSSAEKCLQDISQIDLLTLVDNNELLRLQQRLDASLEDVSDARQLLLRNGLLKDDRDEELDDSDEQHRS